MDDHTDHNDELNSLFQGSNAMQQHTSPHIVSFASSTEEPITAENEDLLETKGKKRKRKPSAKGTKSRAPRKRKEKKTESVLDAYSSILNSNGESFIDNSQDPFFAPPQASLDIPPPPLGPSGPDPTEERIRGKREQLKMVRFKELKDLDKSDVDIKNEFKKVERMGEDDLDFELQKLSYLQTQHFTESLSEIIVNASGFAADKIALGDGEIKKVFEEDKVLKDLVGKQLSGTIGKLSNITQIIIKSSGNVLHGIRKKIQKITNPTPSEQKSNVV